MSDNALATFGIYAYNEEKHIEEAVESALAQTYEPLEVVLSDDGSTDRTVEIMKAIQDRYRGPHTIVINQNPANLGIGGQLNAICGLSAGEYIVMGGGDDISAPDRVARMMELWEESEGTLHSVFTDATLIDETGAEIEGVLCEDVKFESLAQAVGNRFGGVFGATQAFSREVFVRFGHFVPRLKLEDNAILLRAVILGKFQRLREPLVRYRIHTGNSCRLGGNEEISFERWKEQVGWSHRELRVLYIQFLQDLLSFTSQDSTVSAKDLSEAIRVCHERIDYHGMQLDYFEGVGSGVRDHTLGAVSRKLALWAKLKAKELMPSRDQRNYRRTLEQRENRAY